MYTPLNITYATRYSWVVRHLLPGHSITDIRGSGFVVVHALIKHKNGGI